MDREWVIENVTWLVESYGYPEPQTRAITFTPEYFPRSSQQNGLILENMIADLSEILNLSQVHISFDFQEDIRDLDGMPYGLEGKAFQSELIVAKEQYHIILAKNLNKHSSTLLFTLIYEFVKIRLTEDQLPYEADEDTDVFVIWQVSIWVLEHYCIRVW